MARGVVCFGELLLRFTAPGSERLMQSPVFDVHHGGAEANVAVSLARLGHPARMVSALPDNAFGASMLTALKGQGVDVSSVLSAPGRMGLYFLETGAVRRPSRIVYDRAGSVFAETLASRYDWPALLDGAEWLHLSGITPAVGPEPAKAALTAVSAARKAGVRVSFDGNYRQALWEVWGGDGPALICEILESVDTAFINERDIALLLGTAQEPRAQAVARAFDAFPNLQRIAATRREQFSVADQVLNGDLFTREGHWASRPHTLTSVIDRVGGGDAFAAGLLHGVIAGYSPQHTVEFAMAASAIKHSIPGDWNLTNLAEVEDAVCETGLDIRR